MPAASEQRRSPGRQRGRDLEDEDHVRLSYTLKDLGQVTSHTGDITHTGVTVEQEVFEVLLKQLYDFYSFSLNVMK